MKGNDVLEALTADLVRRIESGAGEWRMPWRRLGREQRSVDGRPYRGVNALLLGLAAADRGLCGVWGTYRAWQGHGCQVRRGEKGTHVVLWKPYERPRQGDGDGDGDGDDVDIVRGVYAASFVVFAAEQVDGGDEWRARRDAEDGVRAVSRIEDAERYFRGVGADVREGGDRAFYSPAGDFIQVPHPGVFDSMDAYYSTLAHEHVHWTGHRSRLGRDLSNRFGSDGYAVEELTAELGAALWCARSGVVQTDRRDHAAYLAGWLRVLGASPRALVSVMSAAQAAVDYLDGCAGTVPAGEGVAA